MEESNRGQERGFVECSLVSKPKPHSLSPGIAARTKYTVLKQAVDFPLT